jgi:DNA-binding NtrC family response regulator
MNENKINILIVDDEEQFLNPIKRRLEVREFNVIAVNRGEKALGAARNNPVDIALVDLKMPGIDGEKTLKALKKEHKWMEIVILTGHGSIESAIKCTKSGAYGYLQKPCELDELLEVLKDAYQKKVMNRKSIEEKKMQEILNMSLVNTPREILRKLKEIDNSS